MSKTTEYVSLELSRLDLELRNEQIRHEKAIRKMRNRITKLYKVLKDETLTKVEKNSRKENV